MRTHLAGHQQHDLREIRQVARRPGGQAPTPPAAHAARSRTALRALVPPLLSGLACLLAATALAPLFEGFAWWFLPALAATVVAIGAGALGRLAGRRFGLPATASGLAASLIGLVLAVTMLGARETALLGLLPTPDTVGALRDLALAGKADISELAPPVPERPGLAMLTMVGVYVVAVAVDLIVAVADRPPLAGLPLLSLFVIPAAVLPAGVGTVPFLLGAVGFIALLLLDGHWMVARWGRAVEEGGSVQAGMSSLGLRVAGAALVLAAAVPLVVPSLNGHGVIGPGGGFGEADGGPSSASVVPPFVSLSQQIHSEREVPLITVRTNRPEYLRLTALENFDGHRFTLRTLSANRDARVSQGLPGPETDVRTVPVNATITISEELDERYLPVPGIPTAFEGLEGDWRLARPTGTVFSTRASTAGLSYQVDAVVPTPTAEQLAAATGTPPEEMEVVTALPKNLDPRLPALVEEITRGATTQYQKVLAIQDYLRGPDFTYDLNGAPTTQDGALSEFLFSTRRGYCEQFASAMTVMVRVLGIPARVAIGFTRGVQQADGSWVVTNKQAHAWPEVWFPSLGWLAFEPTRRTDGATVTPSYAPSSADEPAGGGAETPAAQEQPTVVAVPSAAPETPQPAGPTEDPAASATPDPAAGGSSGGGFPLAVLGWTALAVGLLALLSVPALLRMALRRRRLAPQPEAGEAEAAAVARVHAAWAELIDVAADLGIRLRPSDSPRRGVARLISYLNAGPESDTPQVAMAREALERLATAEERARYAPPGMAAPDPQMDIAEDLNIASRTLWSVAPRGRRAFAAVAPPSVMQRVARAPAHGLEVRARFRRGGAQGQAEAGGEDGNRNGSRAGRRERAGVG